MTTCCFVLFLLYYIIYIHLYDTVCVIAIFFVRLSKVWWRGLDLIHWCWITVVYTWMWLHLHPRIPLNTHLHPMGYLYSSWHVQDNNLWSSLTWKVDAGRATIPTSNIRIHRGYMRGGWTRLSYLLTHSKNIHHDYMRLWWITIHRYASGFYNNICVVGDSGWTMPT